MPLITRRSSTRSMLRTSVGSNGAICCHCSSSSQNKFLATSLLLDDSESATDSAFAETMMAAACRAFGLRLVVRGMRGGCQTLPRTEFSEVTATISPNRTAEELKTSTEPMDVALQAAARA